MIDSKTIDSNDEEHCRCGAWKNTSGGEPDIWLEDCERTRCEVWTRVMGYHRPVSAFNAGKRSEHLERQYLVECPTPTPTSVKSKQPDSQ